MLDRRKFKRHTTELSVMVYKDGIHLGRLQSRDLSLGGIFIYSQSPLKLDQDVSLALSLPGQSDLLELVGTVVHSIPETGIGVMFKDLTSTAAESLARFIEMLNRNEQKAEPEPPEDPITDGHS